MPHPALHTPSPLLTASSCYPSSIDSGLPLLSPSAQSAIDTPDKPFRPGQLRSLSGIAARAFFLGASAAASLVACACLGVASRSGLWRVPLFLAFVSTFHFLEFWATAAYNTAAATVDSFLLEANWPVYHIAHASAVAECLIRWAVFSSSWAAAFSPQPPAPAFDAFSEDYTGTEYPGPGAGGEATATAAWRTVLLAAARNLGPVSTLVGLFLVAAGQAVRTAAMAQCGASFNHVVQWQRDPRHRLVTTGIYGRLRHPAYFGFFWWAVGTQLALGNVVCLVAYLATLLPFFAKRIRREEEHLVRFFGDEYETYRKSVGTGIPFAG